MARHILSALLAAFLVAMSSGAVNAGPILNTAGEDLFAVGSDVVVSFLHANAGDTSDLRVTVNGAPIGGTFLFENNNGLYPDGTTVHVATSNGDALVFTLVDLSFGGSYSTGLASTNVSYTIFDGNITNLNNALFAPGEFLSPAAAAAIGALGAGALVISFEDRPLAGSDHDFNDLVFGLQSVRTQVPEPTALPLTMALLSLLCFAIAVRRRGAAH